MKTITELREEIELIKIEKKVESNQKIKDYQELIKAMQVLSQSDFENEREKLLEELKKIELIFPSYLNNFTAFKRKNPINHERDVRKEFRKSFGVTRLKRRIVNLNYLLEKE